MKKECKLKSMPILGKFLSMPTVYKWIFLLGLLLLIVDLTILIFYFKQAIDKYYETLKSIEWNLGGDTGFYPNALNVVWGETKTFTMISNWILAITMIIFPFHYKSQKAQALFFTSIVFITITFVIYWSLISWTTKPWLNPLKALPSFILHAVNPAIGFAALGIIRKGISLKKSQIWLTNTVILGYFTFALIAFFIGSKLTELTITNPYTKNIYKALNITVYDFLNFKQPLFYKGGNLAIVILLDILMFVIGFFLTPGLGFAWKAIYRIKTVPKPQPQMVENLESK